MRNDGERAPRSTLFSFTCLAQFHPFPKPPPPLSDFSFSKSLLFEFPPIDWCLIYPQPSVQLSLPFFCVLLYRTCMWISTASCQLVTGCWSRVTTPPSRSSRSQASWNRSGRPSPQHWMNAARCWRCLLASTRNVTRWVQHKCANADVGLQLRIIIIID